MGRRTLRKRNDALSAAVCAGIVCLLLLAGCSTGVGKEEAEAIALEHVRSYGIVYTRTPEDVVSGVPGYSASVLSNEKVGNTWVILIEVSSLVNGTVKRGQVTIGVNADTARASVLTNQAKTP